MHHRCVYMMHPTVQRESVGFLVLTQCSWVVFPAVAFLQFFAAGVHFVDLPGRHERIHCQSTNDELVVRLHYATSSFSGCIPLIWQTSW